MRGVPLIIISHNAINLEKPAELKDQNSFDMKNVKQDISFLARSNEERRVLDSLTKRIQEIDAIIHQRNSTRVIKNEILLSKNVEGSIAA